MAWDRQFLDQLRDRLSIVDVVSRSIPLVRKGAGHWACCPFHGEKTPSFSVSEAKGCYHCFGCGAHGDIISFTMQMQHLSFIEAVERLAQEAGLEMPKTTPEERERNALSHDMYEVVGAACEYYQGMLNGPEGAAGLKYLEGRGLTREIIANFRLGFAPNSAYGESKLVRYLENKHIPAEKIVAAGLARKDENGDVYDYFRNRVIFPITDSRGRTIAFGGRVMGDGEPKYLNSPETPIFSKGRGLYGLCQAREHVSEETPPIATEGYMDTIALHKFGFKTALAPLGTAITEAQIETLWKLHGEPILCFDSDAAGRNAGVRAALRALPILKPGRTLRFCLIEGAKDPDEFLHSFGHDRFKAMLRERSITLADVLWGYFTVGKTIKTPESRAGLDAEIARELGRIRNDAVRARYQEEFRERAHEAFRNLRAAPRISTPRANPENPNEKMALAFAVCYPSLFAKYLESGAKIKFSTRLFQKMFDAVAGEVALKAHTRETMLARLKELGFEPLNLFANEMKWIVGRPEQAQKLLDEKLTSLARENVAAELKELNAGLLGLPEAEQAAAQERIRALSDELARLDSKLGEVI